MQGMGRKVLPGAGCGDATSTTVLAVSSTRGEQSCRAQAVETPASNRIREATA